MEIPQNRHTQRGERGENRLEDLHLDRVVASHPEIGPTPPDGGYGWMIVLSASIYHITVPTVLILYGLIILKSIREDSHETGEKNRIWDEDIALVPVIMVVIRLLLESWCRVVVKVLNMPRFTALAGLCLTVAGVLLSSYSTNEFSNDHIVSIFAGIFAGAGTALTGQQTDVIITHYFRENLTLAQRLVRMAPSLGNALICLLVGYLCTTYTSDIVVMMHAAILMQNCLFLAAYTRPIYIEKVLRSTYNMIRAVEDDDEVIFSNQNTQQRIVTIPELNNSARTTPRTAAENVVSTQDEENDVVVFNSRKDAKEILDPEVQQRENSTHARFSSDFSNYDRPDRFSSEFSVFDRPNRFSSDFGTLDVSSYSRISGYQELENIDRDGQTPQPLYRETTVNAPSNSLAFTADVTLGTARRTATMKKNFITVMNMLIDLNFYLYTLLHLCTTFSILVLGLLFPSMLWELNPSMNIWSVASVTAIAHTAALCFIMLCIALPKNINEKAKLYATICVCGAIGFYGITLSEHKSFLAVWCMFASFSTAASSVLQQPLYNALNEFDTTATITTANMIVATVIMVWSVAYNYEYKTCFFIASLLQTATACLFLAASFRRRR
ncbi:uncharacterized protein LOC120630084 [Pararge aegeria]|uniref:Jg3162 protein n=1 Tax=Pararge aegeria aegeria TaxID=348720 RepID=A0A8S4R1J7_9NEOP|nr:uncharacterized protein LOC120630084 [Pararge aegeria]CAH2229587.1 jg3162 [Pararge aegeria aegeria]